jgi:hypothetical protein
MRAGRKLWAAVVVGSLLALAPVPSASAARIRECGKVGGPGYQVFNITSRVTSCRQARKMARNYYRGHWRNVPRRAGRRFRRGAYVCRWRPSGVEGIDMRCTASRGRVVRWQASA